MSEKQTIKKSINLYPNLTFEDCVNELRCSKFRKWIIKKLMPKNILFEKVDTTMIAKKNTIITSINVSFPTDSHYGSGAYK